jgi:SpoIID/LytB domain protein
MPYHLDDDPNKTQKYIGYGLEKRSPSISKAVEATKGEIITYNKKSVVIPYFSQSDGKTKSAKEVWNWTDAPYLNSVSDKYCETPTKLLGHGVGISGCGATGMAKEGFGYKEIIKYFLKGVDITKI